ncbi:g1745 [Coccomyxa viridis]|uniref:G1745 protein n=1 Tax=Coccomyxa viridis TaxID=1274662 RepID=A0ABP1FP57_9CHLO
MMTLQGEARVTVNNNGKTEAYTLDAANVMLAPLLKQSKGSTHGALKVQGVAQLSEAQRKRYYAAFGVPEKEAAEEGGSQPLEQKAAQPSWKRRRAADVKEEEDADDSAAPVKEEEQADADAGPSSAAVKDEDAAAAPISEEDDERLAGMNPYERAREERIASNRARLAALDLPGMASKFIDTHVSKPKRPSAPRGLAAKRQKKREPSVPQRASLRIKGIASDGTSVADELRGGQIVLKDAKDTSIWGPFPRYQDAPEPKPREMPTGPMPFNSTIGNERSDKAFLELLKKETSGSTRKAAPEQAAKAVLTEGQLRKLKLKESDVAKVTREGISHLQFHPTSSDLVIATGDKQGHIALWDVDKKTTHEAAAEDDDVEDSGVEDGVYLFRPHTSYVSGLRWATGKLHTAAYDGVVRRMDPQRAEFELLLARDDTEFSAFDCTLDGRVLFLGDNDGNFEMIDTREKADKSNSVNLHDKKLNTLHLEPSEEQVLVSSSGDRTASVWDRRKLAPGVKPLATATANNTILSAYFSPAGNKTILTTGRDNTLRLYDQSMSEQCTVPHNNNTGRWVMPLRATLGPSDTIICGSMKRAVDVYTSSGKQVTSLNSEFQTAISSRCVFHPNGSALAAATASGRILIYR